MRGSGVVEHPGVRGNAAAPVDDDPQRLARDVPPSASRTVSWGSSVSTVPDPTTTASQVARSRWTAARAAVAGDPPAACRRRRRRGRRGSRRPSRPRRAGARARRSARRPAAPRSASACSTPTTTSTPASRRRAAPPTASSVGSGTATTTRAMPASISASAHGPVRPVCAQGSRVTTAVPPRARSPACRQGDHLGVRAAGRGGRALPHRRAVGGEDHRAHRRVRAGRAEDRVAELPRPGHGLPLGRGDAHPRHGRGGLRAQRGDRPARVVGAVDGGAGDEHVGAGLGGRLDGVVVDAAVDLDEQRAGARCRPAPGRDAPWAAPRR